MSTFVAKIQVEARSFGAAVRPDSSTTVLSFAPTMPVHGRARVSLYDWGRDTGHEFDAEELERAVRAVRILAENDELKK